MAGTSEQARLIASLTGKGHSIRDIASLTGRTPRYITQARDSVEGIGRGGKPTHGKGQNLVPFLKELNEKGKVSPASIPERRKGKGGKAAGVRKGIRSFTTKQGKQQTAARAKNGPVTLKRAIKNAAGKGGGLRWDINFKQIVTNPSERTKDNAWVSGQLPDGWTAQTLLDRIDNPKPNEGDEWAAGDVNGALVALTLEQNESTVASAYKAQDFSLFSTE